MRLTLTKALALALVASILPGRRLAAGLTTSPSPARPADPAPEPTPDQCKPTAEPS